MQIEINHKRVSSQLILQGFWLPKNLQTGKTSFYVPKSTLSSNYNTFQPAYIWKYFEIS